MKFGPATYLAAALLVVVGWIVGTAVAAGAWDPVRDATLTPVTEKRAEASGHSVAVYTDIVQADRDIACRGTTRTKAVVEIPPAAIDVVVDDEGAPWHLIGLLPKGRDDLLVTCAPTDKRADNATYAYAVVDGFTSTAQTGQMVILGSLVAGVALAGVTYYVRRTERRARTS